MRRVATDIVMPRYQNLKADEVSEKAADDFVTIADKESEIALAEGLAQILPTAAIVGEEACAANPAVMERLGSGTQWIIDPIDGTGNFAAGRPPFGIMIALVTDGEIQAGWIFDPVGNRLCHAMLGKGAYINDARITACGTGAPLPVAGLSVLFMQPEDRMEVLRRAEGRLTMLDIPRCAAEQYPRIVLGVNDVAVFERTLPWDHAAGALFVNEAGGKVARPDGSPYRIGPSAGRGLLAAASPALWDKAADILYR
jgi:fructose-1,6-bisphosphatase/inositol monophosphatase family enzyme